MVVIIPVVGAAMRGADASMYERTSIHGNLCEALAYATVMYVL